MITWLGWLLAIILVGVLHHNDRRRWRECMRQKNRAKHYEDMADGYKRQGAWLAGQLEERGDIYRIDNKLAEDWLQAAAAATKEDEVAMFASVDRSEYPKWTADIKQADVETKEDE